MKKIKELIRRVYVRRDLLKYLVITKLKLSYAHKTLGYFWSLLDPFVMMIVYLILVTVLFKQKEPQFPILVFSSLLAWQWFTFSLSSSVTSLSGKAKIILSIKFPLAILPISDVLTYLLRYLLGVLSLIPLLYIYHAKITFHILWFPFLIIIQGMFSIGLCLVMAVTGIYFKDLKNIIQFSLRIWFYLSPVLYSVQNSVPEKYQLLLYLLNPFAALFTSYKSILVWGEAPIQFIWVALVISVLCCCTGLFVFSQYEPKIAKDI